MRTLAASCFLAAGLALGAGAASADVYVYGQQNVASESPNDVFFVRYDTDGDGDLTDETMVIRTRAQLAQEANAVVVMEDHAIEAVDSNNDGQITGNEWVLGDGVDRGSLDLNNNGIIDAAE